MTGYERVKCALEHKQPDKIPFDLGASVLTGMNVHTYRRLRNYLGLPERDPDIVDTMQQLALIDEDMLELLKVDVRCVDPDPASVSPLARPVTVDGKYYTMTDEWGIGWNMPIEGGHYFDMVRRPLANAETIADVEKYPWPDPVDAARFATLCQRADKYVFEDKKAYILGRMSAGIWELALWACGFEKFFCDMMINKPFAHALMEKLTDLKMAYWEKALETVGDNVLIVSEADDLATQNSLLCSVDLYKEMVQPYHKRLFSFIKQKAKSRVYIFYHTCGACTPLLPCLIEEGVDILNPVQVNAFGMDTRALKKEFGRDLTFWGGGCDTQHVLPFGTPEQVREETKRRIDDLMADGGFIFANIHNVQSDVPPENFMAMWETLQQYGIY